MVAGECWCTAARLAVGPMAGTNTSTSFPHNPTSGDIPLHPGPDAYAHAAETYLEAVANRLTAANLLGVAEGEEPAAVRHIPGESNPADLFTKILTRQPFEKHRKTVLNLPGDTGLEYTRRVIARDASSRRDGTGAP